MRERIKKLLLSSYPELFPNEELAYNENYIDYGFDSYLLVEFLVLVEEEFELELDDQFLLAENINTIEKIELAIVYALNRETRDASECD